MVSCNLKGPNDLRHNESRNAIIHFLPKDSILVGSGRFLWCPNAKVGTTTIYYILKKVFGEFDGDNATSKGRCFSDCPLSAWKLVKTAEGRQKILNATSFTIVRNPWDRIRSAYVNKIATGRIRPKDGPTGRHMSFLEFIDYVGQHPHANVHWMSYAERCSTSPNLEGRPMFHYDYIVRMEDFNKGLEKVFANAGLKYQPNENKNSISPESYRKRADYFRELTANRSEYDSAIVKVGNIYRDDVVQFGYSFYEGN
eukprot:CAMPEP_0181029610 /NCGR_PEP_ID=MMETSP1070-20121207/5286_1 /TAXON_ID=265543 /ORGANISM="Minutocellus polymorphus, Strain NH13" /LENGTH=254 /DNA_ID=CAMNT_0023106923 /DNA_START=728 /DNA_END=1492 /DNA_ORIENTATION=-